MFLVVFHGLEGVKRGPKSPENCLWRVLGVENRSWGLFWVVLGALGEFWGGLGGAVLENIKNTMVSLQFMCGETVSCLTFVFTIIINLAHDSSRLDHARAADLLLEKSSTVI